MKRLVALVLALCTAFAAPAQLPSDSLDRLRRSALADQSAWGIVEGLSTEIGPRLAGTPAEARARAWAVARLKALGFANVHVEEFPVAGWLRGAESAEIVAPFRQKLVISALGYSGSTGARGITAPVVRFDSLESLRAAPAGSLAGKIAFLTHDMKPTRDGSSYSALRPIRSDGPAIAQAKGALAVVIRSLGTDHHRFAHTGEADFAPGIAPIPCGALSIPDAETLDRVLARGTPVLLHLLLTPRSPGTLVSGNVVAEVPGSDPDAGIILIGGHLDSWDLGQGALDDAAGLAITTAAARQLLAPELKPRRTIRLVWFGAEEIGGLGGAAYYSRHAREKIVLVAESDFGADRVWQVNSTFAPADKGISQRIAAALAPLGVSSGAGRAEGGENVDKWVDAGVAVVDLNQDGMRFFDVHHTADDTLDKIDPAQLRQNVAAWAAMLVVAANDPQPLGRILAR